MKFNLNSIETGEESYRARTSTNSYKKTVMSLNMVETGDVEREAPTTGINLEEAEVSGHVQEMSMADVLRELYPNSMKAYDVDPSLETATIKSSDTKYTECLPTGENQENAAHEYSYDQSEDEVQEYHYGYQEDESNSTQEDVSPKRVSVSDLFTNSRSSEFTNTASINNDEDVESDVSKTDDVSTEEQALSVFSVHDASLEKRIQELENALANLYEEKKETEESLRSKIATLTEKLETLEASRKSEDVPDDIESTDIDINDTFSEDTSEIENTAVTGSMEEEKESESIKESGLNEVSDTESTSALVAEENLKEPPDIPDKMEEEEEESTKFSAEHNHEESGQEEDSKYSEVTEPEEQNDNVSDIDRQMEKYNPFKRGLEREMLRTIQRCITAQVVWDISDPDSYNNLSSKKKKAYRQSLVAKLLNKRKLDAVKNDLNDICSEAEDISKNIPAASNNEHLFGEVSACLGMVLLNSISPNVGCTSVDIGEDLDSLAGNVIVELQDFSYLYCSFNKQSSAQKFVCYLNEYTKCDIVSEFNSDVYDDNDDSTDRYCPFKIQLEERVIQCLDDAQFYQTYEDYLEEPSTFDRVIGSIRRTEDRDYTGRSSDGFYQNGKFSRRDYTRRTGADRYGRTVDRSRMMRNRKYDQYGNPVPNFFTRVKQAYTESKKDAMVSARTFAMFCSVQDKYVSKIPRRIIRKIRSGELAFEEHVSGIASIMAYKILQLTLTKQSGVRDVLVGDVSEGNSPTVLLEDFSNVRCTFISKEAAEDFVRYMSEQYNVVRIR